MPEEDAKIFSEAFEIYNKYRWTEMKTPEQWEALTNEVGAFADRHQWRTNQLTKRIGHMLLDIFSDMYRNGRKPSIPDYFGRDDL